MTVTRFTPHKISVDKNEMLPQEELLYKSLYFRKLTIGIPNENNKFENRIILSPNAVKQLVSEEHTVIIEKDAGIKSNWSDDNYRKAGAFIASKKDVFNAEIIARVSPFNSIEIKNLPGNQIIISPLHSNTQTKANIKNLINKKITAIAFEFVKDENNFYPFVYPMSEIAGILSITTASRYLSNQQDGKGILLGGITGISPAKVIIIGASIAAEYAARAAIGLGASVQIFDNSVAKLQAIKSKLGFQISTSVYQTQIIESNLKSADVVIGALDFNGKKPEFTITEKMIKSMKKGSIIIDLNIDNISSFETSKITDFGNPVFEKHGVIHYCVPNIASEASRTASIALSNALFPIIQKISNQRDTIHIIKDDISIRNGTYIYEGILTNEHIGEKFSLDFKDINLLTAIF